MNDTQRLDALSDYGLFLGENSYLIDGVWSTTCVCYFGIDQSVEAPTLRQAIDLAVETINQGTKQ